MCYIAHSMQILHKGVLAFIENIESWYAEKRLIEKIRCVTLADTLNSTKKRKEVLLILLSLSFQVNNNLSPQIILRVLYLINNEQCLYITLNLFCDSRFKTNMHVGKIQYFSSTICYSFDIHLHGRTKVLVGKLAIVFNLLSVVTTISSTFSKHQILEMLQ